MARARSRSRSYSPRPRGRSPPCERKSYDDYRYHPTDLRDSFERFHPLKDIYLQRNYYIGDPRGFGFVKYRYAEDAAEAMKRMNHKVIGGREVTIVFTEENRKTPQEMRTTNPTSDRYGDYKRSSHRPPRRRYSCKHRHRKASEDDSYSPQRSISISRSLFPQNEREHKSKYVSRSPMRNSRSTREERGLTPVRSQSLSRSHSRSISR